MKKIIAVVLLIVILSIVLWFSTHHTFAAAFLYSFGLFTVVNLWDLIAIDAIWFCHSKKVCLPGTEDMIAEYKDYKFHAIGLLKGCAIGIVVSIFASGIVSLIG